ncbi:ABC transporter permease [Clostridium thermarum]|uniref:ABC transporter permease n=1 Tax=Clostridium thermarum TaxID=1716543 RepID=UPI0013D4580F|nr:ABC transporter permease [Clostridium thermarum]
MIRELRAIIVTLKLQIKQSMIRPMYKYCIIIQPIMYSIITYMMFKKSGQDNYMAFVILGTGILSLWSSICFSSAGDIERERFMGTLPVIYCTTFDFKIIMLAKILGNTILGLVPFVISFAIVKIFFHGKVHIEDPLAFVIAMSITIISFVGIALILSGFFTLSRSSRVLMNCIEYPIFILCGILFPIDILPKWTIPISYVLSPTYAMKVLRMSVEGIKSIETFNSYLGVLIILTFGYFFLAYFLFNVVDRRIRINATLEVM